jgi:hypothetical protein
MHFSDGLMKRTARMSGYGRYGAAGGSCPSGYIQDPNDPTGCILAGAGASGCPPGWITDPTDSTSCVCPPGSSPDSTNTYCVPSGSGTVPVTPSTSSWLTGLGTVLGSAAKSLTGGGVKPVQSQSSILVPLLFVGAAVGVVLYVTKKK